MFSMFWFQANMYTKKSWSRKIWQLTLSTLFWKSKAACTFFWANNARILSLMLATYVGTFASKWRFYSNLSSEIHFWLSAKLRTPNLLFIAEISFFFIEPLVSTEKYPNIPLSNSSCMPWFVYLLYLNSS